MTCNVLMISMDATLLQGEGIKGGDSRARHIFYAQELAKQSPGSKLVILAPTLDAKVERQWLSSHLLVVPVYSKKRWRFFFDAHGAFVALRNEFSFSVVTTETPFDDGLLGWWIARRIHAAFIPQLRGDFFSLWWFKERFPLQFFASLFSVFVLKAADRVQVVSQDIKKKLKQIGIQVSRITVFPSAITFQPFSFSNVEELDAFRGRIGVRPHDIVCLWIGRFSYQKNIPFFCEVIRRVVESNFCNDVRFVVIGDGPLRPSFESFVSRSVLYRDRVSVLGAMPYATVSKWFAASQIFLLTSRYEGLARVLREAAASGLSVVTTEVSGVGEVVLHEETGFVVFQGDTMRFVECVRRLVSDHELREQFGRRAREHERQHFSSEDITKKRVEFWINSIRS